MKKNLVPLRACAAAAVLLAFGQAHAQFSSDGYLRAGTGAGVSGNPYACFGLAGDGLKYRLGNECDTYVEINLKNTAKVGDLQISGNIMPVYSGGGQGNASSTGLGQAYVEGKGFDILPEATFWAGKRYYARSDVHMVDTKFTVEDGTGGGVENIPAGIGKLSIAYFRNDGGAVSYWDGQNTATTAGPSSRVNIELNGININPDGWLRIVTAYVKGEDGVGATTGVNGTGTTGAALTLQHYQNNLFGLGGGNTVYLQYAQGAADLNTNFGVYGKEASAPVGIPEGYKASRVVEAFDWQVGAFGGQAMAMFQNANDGFGKTKSTSFGARAAYAFTTNFKLVGEAGVARKKPYWSDDTQRVTKFTIAPTLSTGRGFRDRPELRVFYTRATWNEAAAAQAVNNLPAGRTSANRYGVQAEIWW